jgi:hypothetical protein
MAQHPKSFWEVVPLKPSVNRLHFEAVLPAAALDVVDGQKLVVAIATTSALWFSAAVVRQHFKSQQDVVLLGVIHLSGTIGLVTVRFHPFLIALFTTWLLTIG